MKPKEGKKESGKEGREDGRREGRKGERRKIKKRRKTLLRCNSNVIASERTGTNLPKTLIYNIQLETMDSTEVPKYPQ